MAERDDELDECELDPLLPGKGVAVWLSAQCTRLSVSRPRPTVSLEDPAALPARHQPNPVMRRRSAMRTLRRYWMARCSARKRRAARYVRVRRRSRLRRRRWRGRGIPVASWFEVGT